MLSLRSPAPGFQYMRSSPHGPGKLRIVAGSLRGSRIDVIDSPGMRPTSDRIRETLFNWLSPMIEGARCLDLFAGSGALGIEALSRGAASCVFVERDRALAAQIKATLVRLRLDAAQVVQADALDWLSRNAEPFDLVFVDPPFDAGLWTVAAEALQSGNCLAQGAWIHVETPVGTEPRLPSVWQLHREGRAGAVRFALYRTNSGSKTTAP